MKCKSRQKILEVLNDYGSGGYLPPVPGPLDPPILQGNPKRKIGILNAGQRRQGVCAAYVTSAVSPKTFCEFLPKYFYTTTYMVL